MKLSLTFLLFALTSHVFAGGKLLLSKSSEPRITNVVLEIHSENKEISCDNGDEYSQCFEVSKRPVVKVTVEYVTRPEDFISFVPEETSSFVERLDQNLFTEAELDALSVEDYQKRMKNALKLIRLKITNLKVTEHISENDAQRIEVIKK